MNYKQIVVFKRPGVMNMCGDEVLQDVQEFAEDNNICLSYYTDDAPLDQTEFFTDNTYSLYVAIGGDGTMLRAMDISIQTNTMRKFPISSVIGFHAGTLGFLTEDPNHRATKWVLDQILNGGDGVQCHNLLALSTTINGKEHFALNEFTFTPSEMSAPLRYDVKINDSQIAQHMGSGCMVATPTGSTAMSMSAGGSIINPTSNVMQFVPIIPHTLSSRPVITSGNDTITISSMMERVTDVIISSDGRNIHCFGSRASITIKKADMPVRVWYIKGRDFFSVLSNKLGW